MVFSPPAWVPKLPFDPPDSIPIGEFWGNERYGRLPWEKSRTPFTCGVSGKSYSNSEMKQRSELLARSLSKRMGWRANEETHWDKVVGVFSFNSIDYIMSTFAVHRLSGIATPANAMYSASELEYQLKASSAKALITCAPLLETALKAAKSVGISEDKVFLMDGAWEQPKQKLPFKTLDELIKEGESLPAVEPLKWSTGQGARQAAYLCFSSGTSGLPKAVMISHRNVIANMMQIRWFESVNREEQGIETQTTLGLLPISHIYGLVVVTLSAIYRGDAVIILPRFELKGLLDTVQRFKINFLYLVPPIIIQMLRNQELCAKYDLSSARFIYTGAAPLGAETHEEVVKAFPQLNIGQAYGMTETSTVCFGTSENDVVVGTSGSLHPGVRAKILDEEGREVTEYGKRGELYIQSPSVTLGYLNNERATADAYLWDENGRWLRTGDVAVVTTNDKGDEHFSVVDRIKELIKTKGHQVAPAELEAHLLSHPAVNDCTVIPVPDEDAGEVPKAFVVKAAAYKDKSDEETIREICKHVEDHKSRYKWLKGGVEFIDVVPKSPSGKILRRLLKDKEREARRKAGSKL
ncbi:GAL4 enhancer protein [Pestalotiopsis sp. IQ-011]